MISPQNEVAAAMITATTPNQLEHVQPEVRLPVQRLGSQTMTVLLLGELLLIVSVLAWMLSTLVPSATPLTATADLLPVRAAIIAILSGEQHDPLVEVNPGMSARASNLRGLSLNGTTYYYYIEGIANFDPFSRGVVQDNEIEVLLRDESGPSVLVIYRML